MSIIMRIKVSQHQMRNKIYMKAAHEYKTHILNIILIFSICIQIII